jgi:hypothetical protein
MRETEIGRIAVPVWVEKKFMKPHLNGKKLSMMACTCHPSDHGKHK